MVLSSSQVSYLVSCWRLLIRGPYFDARQVRICKDIVLLLKQLQCLLSGLILLERLISVFLEQLLAYDVFVLRNYARMSGWQTLVILIDATYLDVFQILLVGLFVDPRIRHLQLLEA